MLCNETVRREYDNHLASDELHVLQQAKAILLPQVLDEIRSQDTVE
jgi:hypothetical protein